MREREPSNEDKFGGRTVHTPSDFTRLLVAPADWSEVGFVIHEATVEERLDVRVLRRDMDLATAGRIFLRKVLVSRLITYVSS